MFYFSSEINEYIYGNFTYFQEFGFLKSALYFKYASNTCRDFETLHFDRDVAYDTIKFLCNISNSELKRRLTNLVTFNFCAYIKFTYLHEFKLIFRLNLNLLNLFLCIPAQDKDGLSRF